MTCEGRGLAGISIYVSKFVLARNGVSSKQGLVGRFAAGNVLSLKSDVTALADVTGGDVILTAVFQNPTCSDSGTYECLAAADTKFAVSQDFEFKGKFVDFAS
ncbi:hypothetical protein ACOMHN_000834 [Nucella lapillus]